MNREAAAASAAASAAAEASKAASIASTQRTSTSLTPDRRAAWVRECVQKHGCKQWQVDAIIAGAPTTEQRRLEMISFAAACEDVARMSTDGSKANGAAVGTIAGAVQKFGLKLLDEMPKTTVPEARKDSDAARGKALKLSGSVVEIRKDHDFFEGNLALDNLTIVHFLTSMSTEGIFDGSFATFRGVYMQEYDYTNVSGGQTRSLLVVGAFDLPANR